MKTDIYNLAYEKVGTVELPDDIFAAKVNEALLWEQSRAQRASARSGTQDTKDRGEVSGGGKKIYKQKGTGQARHGGNRAPIYVGGGVAHGPHPRDYSYRIPRSGRRAALRSALSQRCAEANVVVLDTKALKAPKTKTVATFLAKIGKATTLFVDRDNGVLERSVRNLVQANYLSAAGLNVFDILRHEKLILTQDAISDVAARFARTGTADKKEASDVGA
jgi:large subunit ribosomal protein L4